MTETPSPLTPAEREENRRIAAAATPGPWEATNAEAHEDGSPGSAWGVEATGRTVVEHDFVAKHNAAHIARFSPDMIARYEATLTAAESLAAASEAARLECWQENERLREQLAQAEAREQQLREALEEIATTAPFFVKETSVACDWCKRWGLNAPKHEADCPSQIASCALAAPVTEANNE